MSGMSGSYPGNLRVWDGWAAVATASESGHPLYGFASAIPLQRTQIANHLYKFETLELSPRLPSESAEPYSLEWFLDIENQRHGRLGRWIPKLLEFSKHSGETLLGLGSGLGTDWLQYARHGAHVVVCSPSAEQLSLVRRNFELRGLAGKFVHAGLATLPLVTASIDVVCICGLEEGQFGSPEVGEEIYRVLKPGGKVLAVAPSRYNVDYWIRVLLPWRQWLRNPRVDKNNPTTGYSRKELKELFGRFVEHRIHKRHIRRSEVPPIWRWFPRPWLERLLGRVLVLKAFKPLSAALPQQTMAA